LSIASNAHYTNTRHQLAYALANNYNSLEGDVRMRDGVAVMAHDRGRTPELTLAQWASHGASAGRMLRIDLKEREALNSVTQAVRELKIPDDRLTFNVSANAPWLKSNFSTQGLRELRAAFPNAWITLNAPFPLPLGYELAADAAKHVGGKVGLSLQAQLVTKGTVRHLKGHGLTVSAWNHPPLWQPKNIEGMRRSLREKGVDGMIDLRRKDDPLADD
jgi:hypothetical protein